MIPTDKHNEMIELASQLNKLTDGELKANEANERVQDCLLLLTYSIALTVLESKDKKAAYESIPLQFQPDVKTVLMHIKSNSKTENS